ncbi:hypothetical protein [Undibacterium pigrum]|uniref:Uncharacterized protein n=1 Tax=Undibacterium pigrum TaxID=401470 RepID=A0A318J6X8_9BURK|nr:hypothetical protein [Undibacterium pigrum]PXX39658.1 hypothetical protein DFR42_11022 [Undibacterium pigrum]
MSILFLLLTLAASVLLYLSHRHQAWLTKALPATPVLAVASLLMAMALYCGWQAFSIATAIFAWLVITMLVLGLLPFFSLLKKKKTHGE